MRVLTFILTILFVYISNAQVRSLYPKQDEILTVRTALGIATIIQLTDVIQSAIIGDQSGFRVEYIDKAVTIKPLRYGVKTNLYLVTEKKRYNLRLMTLNQETADFIVYIKEPTVIETVKWKYLNQTIKNKSGSLNITRVGRSTKGFILIEARLIPSQDTAFLPKHIWIKQKEKENERIKKKGMKGRKKRKKEKVNNSDANGFDITRFAPEEFLLNERAIFARTRRKRKEECRR